MEKNTPAIGVEPTPPQGETPPERRGPLGGLRRVLFRPLRRFFDPRFAGVADHVSVAASETRNHLALVARDYHELGTRQQNELRQLIEEIRRDVAAHTDASVEASTFVGEALRDLDARIWDLGTKIDGSRDYFESLRSQGLQGLDLEAAAFLNHANSHVGFASERNLWWNWPISLRYEEGDMHVANVNERIAETAYAFRALAEVTPGAPILDVGATESPVALSLASLGFKVTAVDPRPYPLEHPNLEVVIGAVEELNADEPRFVAVLCISTLEHIGTGEYEQAENERGDEAAIRRIHALTQPGGLLVLTTPFERARKSEERVYDRPQLERLLRDWRIDDFTVARRIDDTTWVPTPPEDPGEEAVALVTARRSA
jgi:2-polyprenyl-3-methyl-5-hydroxy-6-metoxy-1,4-benzoquinol methylase